MSANHTHQNNVDKMQFKIKTMKYCSLTVFCLPFHHGPTVNPWAVHIKSVPILPSSGFQIQSWCALPKLVLDVTFLQNNCSVSG